MYHPEYQYLSLQAKLLREGDERRDRTGTGTLAVFGYEMRFDLADGFPLLTTKRVFWDKAFKEMLWMLAGGRNIRDLVRQGVRIWSDWPLERYNRVTGSHIDKRTFEEWIVEDEQFAKRWGDLGPVYGAQWRGWRTEDGRTIDQVSQVIEMLKNDPGSRRILWEGWNVAELDDMALPPCHKTYQFFVNHKQGRLHGLLSQRSGDTFLGLPFNLINLALVTTLLAEQTGYEPGEIVWQGGDTHLYLNHIEQAKTQLQREPRPFPRLKILNKRDSLFDYEIGDFEIEGYDPHPAIRAPIAV